MSTKDKIWPNFLVIGAGKSGTTSINNYLDQHPDIYMSPKKEPNFYGFEFSKESDFKLEEDRAFFKNSVTTVNDYLELFNGAESFKAIGEVSNTYLYHKDAHLRIKNYIPSVKLIAIFRQPAERLYSRYLHLARENVLPDDPFSNCLDRNTIWWERNDLVKEGFYYKNISKFYEMFESSQIKVFLYEDLKNPKSMMEDIFEFIGVDPTFEPDTTIHLNPSGIVKNKAIKKLFSKDGILNKTIESITPDWLYKRTKDSLLIQKTILAVKKKNLKRPEFNPELKEKLTNVYHEDIKNLSNLINRDLTHWL